MTYLLTKILLLLVSTLFIILYFSYLTYEIAIIKINLLSSQIIPVAIVSWIILAIAIVLALTVWAIEQINSY